MYHDFTFRDTLAASHRAAWRIEDVIGGDKRLDFGRPFMPDSLARTSELTMLDASERRMLNQIRGHEYLCVFGLVEEFILPFVVDHARPQLNGDDYRVRALLQFAAEEAKHIHLFKCFRAAFDEGFGTTCEVIGPPEAVAARVLGHDPLAVALVILQIEWMTQRHFVESVRDDQGLDPLFKSLLRHHWMEEAQHAKLDTLMVEAIAGGRTQAQVEEAITEYLDICWFLNMGLQQQQTMNLAAFERATGRTLSDVERAGIIEAQQQAARWTYIGSGMTHPNFRATVGAISKPGLARVDAAATAFC
jgi:predicted metal-dependent hydrolase